MYVQAVINPCCLVSHMRAYNSENITFSLCNHFHYLLTHCYYTLYLHDQHFYPQIFLPASHSRLLPNKYSKSPEWQSREVRSSTGNVFGAAAKN